MQNDNNIVVATANSLDPQVFAQQVTSYRHLIRDFVADPRDIRLHTDKDGSLLTIKGIGTDQPDSPDLAQWPMNPWAHSQLREFCGVPSDYYALMQAKQHGLLDANVNTWLDYNSGRARMVRTLDGRVRAIVSNAYQRIDNYHVANTVLPVLIEKGATFRRLHVTEDRLLIQAVFAECKADIKEGDTIMLGVTIENDEVGRGAVQVTPMSLRLWCKNGATHNDLGYRRNHVGTRMALGDGAQECYQADTLAAADTAILLQIRDVTADAANVATAQKIASGFQRAEGVPITTTPQLAVAELAGSNGLDAAEETSILAHLLAGGSMTQFGIVNAITRMAQDVEDGMRAHELESLGGDILAMSRQQFGPIAQASEKKRRRRS